MLLTHNHHVCLICDRTEENDTADGVCLCGKSQCVSRAVYEFARNAKVYENVQMCCQQKHVRVQWKSRLSIKKI